MKSLFLTLMLSCSIAQASEVLNKAAFDLDLELVDRLISGGDDVSYRDDRGQNMLHMAVAGYSNFCRYESGHCDQNAKASIAIIESAISHGVDINARTTNGANAISILLSADKGYNPSPLNQVCNELIDHGQNLEIQIEGKSLSEVFYRSTFDNLNGENDCFSKILRSFNPKVSWPASNYSGKTVNLYPYHIALFKGSLNDFEEAYQNIPPEAGRYVSTFCINNFDVDSFICLEHDYLVRQKISKLIDHGEIPPVDFMGKLMSWSFEKSSFSLDEQVKFFRYVMAHVPPLTKWSLGEVYFRINSTGRLNAFLKSFDFFDVNRPTELGYLLIGQALGSNPNLDMLRILLERGADPLFMSYDGIEIRNPLCSGPEAFFVFEKLDANRVKNINCPSYGNLSQVYLKSIVYNKKYNDLKKFLEFYRYYGADLYAPTSETLVSNFSADNRFFGEVTFRKIIDALDLLISKAPKSYINFANQDGKTALNLFSESIPTGDEGDQEVNARIYDYYHVFSLFSSAGADFEHQDHEGNTACSRLTNTAQGSKRLVKLARYVCGL